jgi:hypothetical protein
MPGRKAGCAAGLIPAAKLAFTLVDGLQASAFRISARRGEPLVLFCPPYTRGAVLLESEWRVSARK